MVPNAIKVPVPFDYVFPAGALFLGVEPVKDWDAKGKDDQAKDKDTGERLWVVKVLDLDPEAGRFGASKEVKVKIAASVQPVPPAPKFAGMPPVVAFTDVVLTPYVDSSRCRGGDKCKARQTWSVRAGAMVDPTALDAPASAEGNGSRAARAVKAAA